jgi:hypothetical protein
VLFAFHKMVSKLALALLLQALLASAQKAAGPSPAEVNGSKEPPKDQGGIFGGNMLVNGSPKLGGGAAGAPKSAGSSSSSMTAMLSGGKAGGGILGASKSSGGWNARP